LSSDKLHRKSERSAVAAFHRAAKRVEAYRKFLDANNVKADTVTDADSFSSIVPTTNKESVFAANDLPELCVDGKTSDVSAIFTSSGFSSSFSFGLDTEKSAKSGSRQIDLMLEMYLHTSSIPTLLVNALPMGIHIPATLPAVFDSSTRADSVIAVIKKAAPIYKQVILAAEQPFLKKRIDEGLYDGIYWPSYNVSVITGAEIMPENLRTYIGSILGHDPLRPESGRFILNMGVSEVGTSIGHETDDCRRLRQAARDDEELSKALLGPSSPYLPSVIQYFPQGYYIETPQDEDGQTRMVITTTSPSRPLPLIRYETGDIAKVLTCNEMGEILRSCGREDLLPTVQLPFILQWGRGKYLSLDIGAIYPEQVKEAIYAEHAVARSTTANFFMRVDSDSLQVDIQLRRGAAKSAQLEADFQRLISEWTSAEKVSVNLIPFEEFSDSLELTYQRKFRYL